MSADEDDSAANTHMQRRIPMETGKRLSVMQEPTLTATTPMMKDAEAGMLLCHSQDQEASPLGMFSRNVVEPSPTSSATNAPSSSASLMEKTGPHGVRVASPVHDRLDDNRDAASIDTSVTSVDRNETPHAIEAHGYLRGIDMAEEVAMSLLDTSLLTSQSTSNMGSSVSSSGTPRQDDHHKILDTAPTPQQVLQEWRRTTDSPYSPFTASEHINHSSRSISAGSAEDLLPRPRSSTDSASLAEMSSVFRQNITDVSVQETQLYVKRIAELEAALLQAHKFNDRLQSEKSRKEKNGELETDNKPAVPDRETLWERNKTLIKEVRFADQTCVELSAQRLALSQQVEMLQEQLDHTRREKEQLMSRQHVERLDSNMRDQDKSASQRKELEERLDLLQGERDSFKLTVEELKMRLAASEKLFLERSEKQEEEFRERIRQAQSDHERKFQELATEKELVERDLNDTFKTLDEVKWELQQSIFSVEKVTTENNRLVNTVRELGDRQKVDNELLEELREQNTDFLREKTKLCEDLDRASVALGELEDLTQETKRLLCEKSAECAELRDQLEELKQTCENFEARVLSQEQLEAEKVELESELGVSSQRISDLENQLHSSQEGESATRREVALLQKEIVDLKDKFAEERRLLEEDRDVAKCQMESVALEVQRARASMSVAAEESEEHLATTRKDLEKTVLALEAVKTECQRSHLPVGGIVERLVASMQVQAEAIDREINDKSRVLCHRMSSLENTLSFLRESIVFEVDGSSAESSDGSSVDPEMSTLTENTQSRISQQTPAVADEELECIEATFDSDRDKSTDLELMEEARLIDEREFPDSEELMDRDVASYATSKESGEGDGDSLSSIAGLSHLFAEDVAIDMSISVSRGPDTATNEPQVQDQRPSPPCGKKMFILGGGEETNSSDDDSTDNNLCSTDELDLRLSSLVDELAEVKSQLTTRDNECDVLRTELQTVQREKADLEAELCATMARAEEHCQEFGVLQAECNERLGDNKQLLQECEDLRGNIDDLEKDCSILRDAVEEIRAERDASIAECESLGRRIKDLSCAREDAERAMEFLQKELADRAAEIEAQNVDNTSYSTEISKLRKERVDLRQDLAELQTQAQSLTQERDHLLEEMSQCEQERDKKRSVLEQRAALAESESKRLETRLKDVLDELSAVSNEKARVSADLDLLHEEFRGSVSECESLKERLELVQSKTTMLEEERDRFRDEMSALAKRMDEALKESASTIRLLTDENGDLKQKLNDGSRDLDEALGQSGSLRSSLEQLLSDKAELECTLERSRDRFVALEKKVAQLETMNSESALEVEEYKSLLKSAEDLALHAEERLLQEQNRAEEYRFESDRIQETCRDLSDRLERTRNEHRMISSKLQQKVNEVKELESSKREAEAAVSGCQKQIEELSLMVEQLRTADFHNEEEEQGKSENDGDAVMRIKAALRESHAEALEMRARKDSLETKCQRLGGYVRKLTDKCDEWESYCTLQGEVLEKLKSANAKTKKRVVEIARMYRERDQVSDSVEMSHICHGFGFDDVVKTDSFPF